MEEGSFRCDANISIRPEGSTELLAKIEVKNMNSFKAVYKALAYEAERQRKVVTKGGKLAQETRGWVEVENKTVSQRSKEYAHDYRYFPEPDLPPIVFSKEKIEEIKASLPELPETRRDRFLADFKLSQYEADLLTASRAMADYFESCLAIKEMERLTQPEKAKVIGNVLLGEVNRIINNSNIDIIGFKAKVSPAKLVRLLSLNVAGTINTATMKSVLEDMFASGGNADDIIEAKGLSQISDSAEVEKVAAKVIQSNPNAVADYRAGKEQSLKFLVGRMMKETQGRVNPGMAADLLKKKLGEE
jgi:aspartyl-tRNA(Asn)/glutamyl-tRNA(Gln) amidotransferase subunit B